MNNYEDFLLHRIDKKPRKKTPTVIVEKRNKYGAVAKWVDGHYFKSKKETRRYIYLKHLQEAKEISNLEIHPKFPLCAYDINGDKVDVCVIELDFGYMKGNKYILEDTKGMDLPMSKLKRKWFEKQYHEEVIVI